MLSAALDRAASPARSPRARRAVGAVVLAGVAQLRRRDRPAQLREHRAARRARAPTRAARSPSSRRSSSSRGRRRVRRGRDPGVRARSGSLIVGVVVRRHADQPARTRAPARGGGVRGGSAAAHAGEPEAGRLDLARRRHRVGIAEQRGEPASRRPGRPHPARTPCRGRSARRRAGCRAVARRRCRRARSRPGAGEPLRRSAARRRRSRGPRPRRRPSR